MFAQLREQNKLVQTSAACQRGPRRAHGDTIESRGYVSDAKCSLFEGRALMVLCSRALRKYIEGGHDWSATDLQMQECVGIAVDTITVNSCLVCAMAGCCAHTDNGQCGLNIKRQD